MSTVITLVKATPLDFFEHTYLQVNIGELSADDIIVAETKRGIELYRVIKPNYDVNIKDIVEPDGKVIRLATEEDIRVNNENSVIATEAMDFCKSAVKDEQLEMKLVDAKYTLDKKKLIFFFTADTRVDFRALVRTLATEFRTRIELRQIGLREKARFLGGVGPCGLSHCCSSYLGDFTPVSIQMAKNQDLSLTPTKISGACGKLMCCLSYENDYYEEARKDMPDVGARIKTPAGRLEVIGINILDLVVRAKDKENYIHEFTMDELQGEA